MKKLITLTLVLIMCLGFGGCSSKGKNASNDDTNKTDEQATLEFKTVENEFRGLKYSYPDFLNNVETYDDEQGGEPYEVYHSGDDYMYDLIIYASESEYDFSMPENSYIWMVETKDYKIGKFFGSEYGHSYRMVMFENGQPKIAYDLTMYDYDEDVEENLISMMEYNGKKLSLDNKRIIKDVTKILPQSEVIEKMTNVHFSPLNGKVLKFKAPIYYKDLRPYFDSVESYSFNTGDEIIPGEYVIVDVTCQGITSRIGYMNESEESVHFNTADELTNDGLTVFFLDQNYDQFQDTGFGVGEEAYTGNTIEKVISEFGEGYLMQDYGDDNFEYTWSASNEDAVADLQVYVKNGVVQQIGWSYYAY